MDVYLKNKSTYRTIGRFVTISDALVMDSLDRETGTVTVVGTDIGRKNTGDWIVAGTQIYSIAAVKPQGDRTTLTLAAPLDIFDRLLELPGQPGDSIGGCIAGAMRRHYAECADPIYAMPYLVVSNSDTSPIVSPEPDRNGLWRLTDYARLMRKTHRVTVRFRDAVDHLLVNIQQDPPVSRQIVFDDGHSQLASVDYSSKAVAKLTVLQESGQEGQYRREDWYLAEDGSASTMVPSRRAEGRWDTITIRANDNPREKVLQAFAKNKSSHKLEFYSDKELHVGDDCTFSVYGETLQSYISYKRKSTSDRRYFYRSGELAVTASEKLRGVTSK